MAHESLPMFGPLRSVKPYSCLLVDGLTRRFVDEQVQQCVCVVVPLSLPSYLASTYSGPVPLPLSQWWEGIPQWPNLKGDRSTSPPCPKVVFACKVAGGDAEVGSAMTSVFRACGLGLVTPEWKHLARCLGNPRSSLSPLHQRGNYPPWRASARLASPLAS